MVARTTKIRRTEKAIHSNGTLTTSHNYNYHLDQKNTNPSPVPVTDRRKPSKMQNCEPEKENHLIEAIVFTTDFLSCYKEPIRSSNWIIGSDSTEMLDTNDYPCSYSKEDGSFGMKRKQLICYENSDDLTRKVDALFRQERSPLPSGAALDIRDDLMEEDELFDIKEEEHRCFDSRSRQSHRSSTSTCPSTNPSLTPEELNNWYSSSWSSFRYYGSAKESYMMPTGTPPESICHSPKRSPPSRTKTRRPHSSEEQRACFPSIPETITDRGISCSSASSSTSSSMPDCLRGVQFKSNTGHRRHKTFPVIALPPSPPNSFTSGEDLDRDEPMILPPLEEARTRIVNSQGHSSKLKKNGRPTAFRRHRLGWSTRHYWEKAKRFFRP
jgi:hypothetical protein